MAQKKHDVGRLTGRKNSDPSFDGLKSGLGGPKSGDTPANSGGVLGKPTGEKPMGLNAKLAANSKSSPIPPPLPGQPGEPRQTKSVPASKSDKPNFDATESKTIELSEASKSAELESDLLSSKPELERGDGTRVDGASASGRRSAQRRPAGPVRERIAANDDVPSIGGLIYALEQKPSTEPFKYAAIGSVIWALIGIGFGWLSLSSEIAAGAGFVELLSRPVTFITLAGIALPIAVIWFLSVLAWRAEELRLRSSTMTEVAVRLAEPDRLAEQSVASLGQAVRRQVSFMNDAVSRALGRAGELEALVHNEVAALENSYEENERKIRGLINELSDERAALAGTGGEFADTLKTMGQEVPALIEKLSGQQSKLAAIIGSAGDNLTALETSLGSRTEQLETVLVGYSGEIDTSLGARTEEIRGVLGEHSTALQEAIGARTDDMRNLLGDYTTALAAALGSRTEQMETTFTEHMEKLDTSIGQRTDNLQTVFEEYGQALDSTLANRADALDTQLIERTRALDTAFNERLQLFDDSILRSTQAIDTAVGEKAEALTTALDSHAKTFHETISQQSADLDESLVHGISAVRRSSENITRQSLKAIEGLAGQSDLLKGVSENLLGQINTLTNRFDTQTQSIMGAASALESANYKIDSTLRTRQVELSQTLDRVTGTADEFSKAIEGSMSDAEQRTRAAAEDLKSGAQSQKDTVLAEFEQFRTDADQQSTRALEDMRNRFATVSDEVTSHLGSISERVDDSTGDLRKRAAQAAAEIAQEQERLKAELAAIPAVTREGSETMRRALQDQLAALERLSEISKSRARAHDVSAPVASTDKAHLTNATPESGASRFNEPSSRTGSGTRPPNPPAVETAGRGLSSLSSSVARELAARGNNFTQKTARTGPPSGSNRAPQPGREAGGDKPQGQASGVSDRWSLGDLLHRASFDDDEGATNPALAPNQPNQPAPPLPPAAVAAAAAPKTNGVDIAQIARAMKPAVATQVWERLRAGQRGFLSREMYTPEGRIVFDDVGYRLNTEPGIKASVHGFVTDFEQSLRDAERSDPSGRKLHAQLSSDPARVYLFLAHVSGRLH